MDIEKAINYEDIIELIADFEKKGQEMVNKNPSVIIPYYTLDHLSTELSIAKTELEKKEAEIDKLRNTNKDLLKKLRNRVKEVKKLTRYSLYKKEFARLNKQLEKKDTVIDLMAKKLVEAHGWFYSEFDNYTKEDFKQYFYKKAEEK